MNILLKTEAKEKVAAYKDVVIKINHQFPSALADMASPKLRELANYSTTNNAKKLWKTSQAEKRVLSPMFCHPHYPVIHQNKSLNIWFGILVAFKQIARLPLTENEDIKQNHDH